MSLIRRLRRERAFPVYLLPCLLLFITAIVLQIAGDASPALGARINYYAGGGVRILLAFLTGWIPFSVAEFLLLASPLLLTLLIVLAARSIRAGLASGVRFLGFLLSVVFVEYALFSAGLGFGFHTPTLDERLSLEDRPVSAEELYETILWAGEEANALCGSVDFRFGGASVTPFADYDAMCRDLMVGYARLHEVYPIFIPFTSRIKPVILSEPMSYTHITGIYTFFTGESNLNVHFPDYTLPFTAAHELAHQRGFSRENEANFIAFLVCTRSDNPYTRYSGYVNMVEYLSNALYSADKTLWQKAIDTLDYRIRYEMQAYNDFYEKYKENKAAEISGALNDTYLKSQGQTAGTKSYGLVVDLAVSYYYSQVAKEGV